MKEKKFYIIGKSEGAYHLVTEDGEHLASHYCSNAGFALGDLVGNRPERKAEWKERFGDYKVLYVGNDEMTEEELRKRNKEFYKDLKV